jgi:2-dehydro-3-deoxygluconokinase
MGVRLTPAQGQPVYAGTQFTLQATSAETNVASIASSLGVPVKALTAFVAGSPVAYFIKSELSRRFIEFEGNEVTPDSPWGVRHQFNIADSGFGARGPRVTNDRAGEVGLTISSADFDLDKLFDDDGVQIVHLSGLIAALAPNTGKFCIALAERAHASGSLVSFDLNYRASFWKNREAELRRTFLDIAARADILVGNEEDFQLALGIEGPALDAQGDKIQLYKAMTGRVTAAFPQVKLIATTLREVVSANEHLWGAMVWSEGNWYEINPRPIRVLDRIGGGDAFVGGLLYGLLRGWNPERAMQFGWAAGAMAVTLLTDYVTLPSEDILWDIWRGNARVKR